MIVLLALHLSPYEFIHLLLEFQAEKEAFEEAEKVRKAQEEEVYGCTTVLYFEFHSILMLLCFLLMM